MGSGIYVVEDRQLKVLRGGAGGGFYVLVFGKFFRGYGSLIK